MSVSSLFYQESDATIAHISQSLLLIVAGKQLEYIWYEEITLLSPYTLKDFCSNFAVFHCQLADMLSDLRTLLTLLLQLSLVYF